MKARRLFWLVLLLAMTAFAPTAKAQAQDQVLSLIQYGDSVWRSGNPQGALPYFNQAYNLAQPTGNPYYMFYLSGAYLGLGYEQAAATCYYNAVTNAYNWMNRDPGRGQMYAFGLNALQALVGYYNNTLRMIPASQTTQQWFRSQTVAAQNVVNAQAAPRPQQPATPPQTATPAPRTQQPSTPGPTDWDPWADLRNTPYSPRTPSR